MGDYAHPEILVGADWVAEHAGDDSVRVVEVDVDTGSYDEGHIPGAVGWAWDSELCDTVRRDIVPQAAFEKLMSDSASPTIRRCALRRQHTTGSRPGRSGNSRYTATPTRA